MRSARFLALAAVVSIGAAAPFTGRPTPLDPLVYTISFPDPASKAFDVAVDVPAGGRPSVDLMMAIWSPGFYGLQNYGNRVSDFTAKAADGTVLDVS